MNEIVKAEGYAVIQQVALQTNIEFLGCLPLDIVITNVSELNTHGIVVILAGAIVVLVVVSNCDVVIVVVSAVAAFSVCIFVVSLLVDSVISVFIADCVVPFVVLLAVVVLAEDTTVFFDVEDVVFFAFSLSDTGVDVVVYVSFCVSVVASSTVSISDRLLSGIFP